MQLDGYIRVSKVGKRKGESFISPEVQREEIGHAIGVRGAQLGEMFWEPNKSGMRAHDRPRLMEAIERIESGISDGIVVARLNRFGRSFEDGIRLMGRIKKAGATLISVREGFDLSTPTGRLVANILFSVAEWEIEAKRESWDDARRKRIERGKYICHKAPAGYRKRKDGRLEIDPIEGPVIAELFRLRLAGVRMPELLEFLNNSQVKTLSGKPFCSSRVYALFKNTAYKGTAHSGRHEKPNAHPALIEPDEWQACQAPPRRPRRWVESLLAGRVRCACCGGPMTSIRSRGNRTTSNVYRCCAKLEDCMRPAQARGEELDPLVEEFIFRHTSRPGGSDRQSEEARAALEQAEEDLAGYRDNVSLARTLGEERFEAGVTARIHLLERRMLELARVQRARQGPGFDLRQLEAEWHSLSWEKRCSVTAELVDLIVVERGNTPVIERAWVYRRGRGPLLEPGESLDFQPPREGSNRLHEHRLWGERRIEEQLNKFFEGREPRWPHYLEFAKVGRGRLHAQVLEWGGPYYWAHRIGVERPEKFIRWNQHRLRGALRPFLKSREHWPTRVEFEAVGLENLYESARRHGGLEYWAREFGLSYSPRNGGYRGGWPEQRIEGELRNFLEGRKVFPPKTDFAEAGKALTQCALPPWRHHLLGRAFRTADGGRRARPPSQATAPPPKIGRGSNATRSSLQLMGPKTQIRSDAIDNSGFNATGEPVDLSGRISS